MRNLFAAWLLLLALLAAGCGPSSDSDSANDPYAPKPYIKLQHPEWSRNATLYQLNTRQFTKQGTFRAAEAHLPRIKALGADIVWLMPINPIGYHQVWIDVDGSGSTNPGDPAENRSKKATFSFERP